MKNITIKTFYLTKIQKTFLEHKNSEISVTSEVSPDDDCFITVESVWVLAFLNGFYFLKKNYVF